MMYANTRAIVVQNPLTEDEISGSGRFLDKIIVNDGLIYVLEEAWSKIENNYGMEFDKSRKWLVHIHEAAEGKKDSEVIKSFKSVNVTDKIE